MVDLNQDIVMDSKGRILIPLEIRKLLQMNPGETFKFSLENGKLFLLKSSEHSELIQEIEKFQGEVKKVLKTAISTEKLF